LKENLHVTEPSSTNQPSSSIAPGKVVAHTNGFAGKRLFSLDALRGFDMFWIMGADEIFHTLAKATGSPFLGSIANQFTHPDWNGFHFYDLIFPLFLFIAGVATPYSVGRELRNGSSRGSVMAKVIRRGLILVLLGIIANNGLQLKPLAEIRFGSVLGRIGLAYLFANVIYIYSSHRAQLIWLCSLLVGYWLLLRFNSAPGFQPGDLTMEGNFASYMDRLLLPGKLYLGYMILRGWSPPFLQSAPGYWASFQELISGRQMLPGRKKPSGLSWQASSC
jgi:predicted acyltransferase